MLYVDAARVGQRGSSNTRTIKTVSDDRKTLLHIPFQPTPALGPHEWLRRASGSSGNLLLRLVIPRPGSQLRELRSTTNPIKPVPLVLDPHGAESQTCRGNSLELRSRTAQDTLPGTGPRLSERHSRSSRSRRQR